MIRHRARFAFGQPLRSFHMRELLSSRREEGESRNLSSLTVSCSGVVRTINQKVHLICTASFIEDVQSQSLLVIK